jgi:hypothetical protein
MHLVVCLVFSFTIFVFAELQNLEFAACCAPVVCFVSPRFSTVALSRNFRADRDSCCMILTTCRPTCMSEIE